MARPMIVLDDPGHETKKKLRDIAAVVDRPYSWVLRRIADNAHTRLFKPSTDADRRKELVRLGLF